MIDVERLRREEFAPVVASGIYLNSASTGPLPARAVDELARGNADRADPSRWTVERQNDAYAEARRCSAALINADPATIALMPNTTTGINVAARAIPLSRGDVVLTFDREFPTNVYPWLVRAADGVVLERIPVTDAGWPDEARLLDRLADPRVRAVCVSLTQFSTGYTVDLDALSRATRATGTWLIVDAIQGVGQVPVDVARTPVDFLACGAQKWLLSPWGTGFLHVRGDLIGQVTPTFAGWASFRGTDDYSRLTAYDPEPWPDARRFEVITLPVQDYAAMNAAVGLMLEVGLEAIASHARRTMAPILEWAERGRGTITSPMGRHGSAITCVRPLGDVAAAHRRLTAAGVGCSLREGSIRLSPHCFNTVDELAAVAELLGKD